MGIPSSGDVNMSEIATEYGGSTPHSLSEYYGEGQGIASSGAINMGSFRGTSGSTIDYLGYSENKKLGGNNTGSYYATMPSNASSAELIVTCIWHDSATYTAGMTAASGWTKILSGNRGRPAIAVFVKYGSATNSSSQLVATGPSGVGLNFATVCFNSNRSGSSYFKVNSYNVEQWHTGNQCWNGLGPSSSNADDAKEYYMIFWTSARPTGKTQTVTTSGNSLTLLNTSDSLAQTYRSNKLYGANGDPGDWNTCMYFGTSSGSYAWTMIGVW
jgi:hypothetical protein